VLACGKGAVLNEGYRVLNELLAQDDPFWKATDDEVRETFLAALERMYPDFKRADVLADRLHRLAVAVGGTVTGEHGTGAVRQQYMRLEHGAALDVMKKIKDTLDPKGILNPGKIYGS